MGTGYTWTGLGGWVGKRGYSYPSRIPASEFYKLIDLNGPKIGVVNNQDGTFDISRAAYSQGPLGKK